MLCCPFPDTVTLKLRGILPGAVELETTARWKADEVEGPEESVNKGASQVVSHGGIAWQGLRRGRLHRLSLQGQY